MSKKVLLCSIILLIILFVLFYSITESNIESFEVLQERNIFCNDVNAINYYKNVNPNKKLTNDDIVDNSYCYYNTNYVCNRPFANNYNYNYYDLDGGCDNQHYDNYEDVYVKDDKGNKIKLQKSELHNNNTYFGREVNIDNMTYKNDNSIVYKQKKKIDNSKCKKINNKICRFPMSNTKINSLRGISKDDNEFNSMISDKNEILPGKYLTQGQMFTDEEKKLRRNKKVLFNELFYNSNEISGHGFNIWDLEGKVDIRQLQNSNNIYKTLSNVDNETKFELLHSYIDFNNNIKIKKGYKFQSIPRNYLELVEMANRKGYHIALAVSENAEKYAIGIASTKSIACDIALSRCISFIDYEDIEKYFKGMKFLLLDYLKKRRNVYEKKNIFTKSKIILNSEKYKDMVKYKENLFNYLEKLDDLTLGNMLFKYLSHKEIYEKLNNSSITDDIVKKSEGLVDEKPKLNELLRYLFHKMKTENITNKCGILMINSNRYENFDNDITDLIDKCKPLPKVNKLCNKEDNGCQEISAIGLDKGGDCMMFQDYSNIFVENNYNKLPIKNGKNMINEREEILKNERVDLANSVLDKCNKMSNNNCVLYKINSKIYSYNSLY